MDRIFHAFVASRAGKNIGILGFWPNRAFDAKFVAPAEESTVVEAFLANGSLVDAEMVSQLDDEGLSLVEVDVTNQDTVFSVYSRLMSTPAGASISAGYAGYWRSRGRPRLLIRR